MREYKLLRITDSLVTSRNVSADTIRKFSVRIAGKMVVGSLPSTFRFQMTCLEKKARILILNEVYKLTFSNRTFYGVFISLCCFINGCFEYGAFNGFIA